MYMYVIDGINVSLCKGVSDISLAASHRRMDPLCSHSTTLGAVAEGSLA